MSDASKRRPARVRRGHKRAANGKGSVYKRSSDGRYVASLTVDGKPYTRYARTEAEADEKLDILLREAEDGRLATTDKQTLIHYLATWLEDWEPHQVSPKTVQSYTQRMKHVGEIIGAVTLASLRPVHIERLHSELRRRRLSTSSIGAIHSTLSSALRRAERLELIRRNPCSAVSPPPARRPEVTPPTVAEMTALLASLEGTRYHALTELLMMTGMRVGEALSLQWEDIDFDGARIHVRTTLTEGKGTGVYRGPTKTHRSTRPIPIAPATIRLLKAQALAIGRRGPADLVFPTENGGFISRSLYWDMLRRRCLTLGIGPYSAHDFRHAFVTLALRNGADVQVVQRHAGHASTVTTWDRYGHVVEGQQRELAETVVEILKEST